jgi:hypothetical protein
LSTINRNEPAASPGGKFATICVLLDETNVNSVPFRDTAGEPAVGVRLVPVMAICCVTEFTMALMTTGVWD